MKKATIVVIALAFSMLMAFAGCGETSDFGVIVDDESNASIMADNAGDDMAGTSGGLVVEEGDTVTIEPALEEGKIHVAFLPMSDDPDADIEELVDEGKAVFEAEVEGSEPIECNFEAGDYVLSAKVMEKATGTVEIKVVEDEGDELAEVASAVEAAQGAGNMEEFEVPAELKINDQTFTDPKFSYLDGVAQASYEQGAIGIYVRKACGIYGGPMTDRDLESFQEHWTQQVGDDAEDVVDCYGMEKDSAIVIQWGDEAEFYTVTSQGLGGEEYGMDAATVQYLEEVID